MIAETPPSNEIYLPFPIENSETKPLEILNTNGAEKTANPENSLQQNPKVTSNKDTSSIGNDVNPLGKDLLNSNSTKVTETKKKKIIHL